MFRHYSVPKSSHSIFILKAQTIFQIFGLLWNIAQSGRIGLVLHSGKSTFLTHTLLDLFSKFGIVRIPGNVCSSDLGSTKVFFPVTFLNIFVPGDWLIWMIGVTVKPNLFSSSNFFLQFSFRPLRQFDSFGRRGLVERGECNKTNFLLQLLNLKIMAKSIFAI